MMEKIFCLIIDEKKRETFHTSSMLIEHPEHIIVDSLVYLSI